MKSLANGFKLVAITLLPDWSKILNAEKAAKLMAGFQELITPSYHGTELRNLLIILNWCQIKCGQNPVIEVLAHFTQIIFILRNHLTFLLLNFQDGFFCHASSRDGLVRFASQWDRGPMLKAFSRCERNPRRECNCRIMYPLHPQPQFCFNEM